MKRLSKALLVVLLLCALLSISAKIVDATDITGTVSSSVTWTKNGSPYRLTGNLTVASGATLTVEPGVTIQIPSNCILQVNGTLVARGTSSEKISFNGGDVSLSEGSSSCIIENTIFDCTNLIVASSATIKDNTLIGRASSESFEAVLITGGAPIISNNLIYGADSQRGMRITGGSPTITKNGIMGMIISEGNNMDAVVISHNTIEGGVSLSKSGATITNNLITGFKYVNFNGDVEALFDLIYDSWLGSGIGITADYTDIQRGVGGVITDNVITGCMDGISVLQGGTTTIERNLIVNTTRDALHVSSDAVIRDNTLRNNQRGIVVGNMPTVTINNNNLEDNGNYSVYLYTGVDVDATSNWWGTTNMQTIENYIWDSTFEPYAGTLNLEPILTEPNQNAYPNSMTFPSINMPGSDIPGSNPFRIGTNSTVTDVVFNPENASLSFSVSGPDGTEGSVNVTVAKSAMPNGEALEVTLDGEQINYSLVDEGNSWNIGIAYMHSSHRVTITDPLYQPAQTSYPTPNPVVDESNTLLIAAVATIVAVAAVSSFIIKSKRKTKT